MIFNPFRQPVDIELPRHRGYISVTANGRYFQDESGLGFIPIGQNDGIPWPGLVDLLQTRDSQAAEAYIRDLRAHGVNVSRIMMEYAQDTSTYFEQPVGNFNPEAIAFWDRFIELAENQGLYLLLTPYDTFWQAKTWESYPYNAVNGGPCKTKRDWLTAPDAIQAQKMRWEFMLQRWGGSPAIFAWDLMNEIDLWWGCTADEINTYITEMATFVRETELALWRRTHLLTASSASAVPEGALGQVIYNHPALDFANTHLYAGFGVREPVDTIEGAYEFVEAVRLSLQSIRQPRPYFDSESGPIDGWIKDARFDTEYHHNLSWAHLASGGAGSGMRWPYTWPHHILPEMRDNLLGMARFASTVDWVNFNSRSIAQRLRVDRPGILKTGCGDKHTAIVWLLADKRLQSAPSLDSLSLKIYDILEDGEYTVEIWETYNGNILDQFLVSVEGRRLQFTLPAFDVPVGDVAIKISPIAT
jgi:mannan endo-1,4-beta-mannosidase